MSQVRTAKVGHQMHGLSGQWISFINYRPPCGQIRRGHASSGWSGICASRIAGWVQGLSVARYGICSTVALFRHCHLTARPTARFEVEKKALYLDRIRSKTGPRFGLLCASSMLDGRSDIQDMAALGSAAACFDCVFSTHVRYIGIPFFRFYPTFDRRRSARW
jgi:hypothetical protein